MEQTVTLWLYQLYNVMNRLFDTTSYFISNKHKLSLSTKFLRARYNYYASVPLSSWLKGALEVGAQNKHFSEAGANSIGSIKIVWLGKIWENTALVYNLTVFK